MNIYAILKILILNKRFTLTEMQSKLDTFLAMNEITTEQYVELTDLATKNETDMRDDVAELNAKLDALLEYQGLNLRQIDSHQFEVAKEEVASGDYTDPIPWNGESVEIGKWYYTTEKELPREAIKSGVPSSWDDSSYFDWVL